VFVEEEEGGAEAALLGIADYRILRALMHALAAGLKVDSNEGLSENKLAGDPGDQERFNQVTAHRNQMHELLDRVLEADSQEEPRTRLDDLRGRLKEKAPSALGILGEGFYDAIAVLTLPEKYRKRLRTTNMLERFIQEIRRRETVIRIFPNINSAYRLVGALCAEPHEGGPLAAGT